MTLQDRIRGALATVEDPEVPITLADLGVLREVEFTEHAVRIVLVPTRLGCPARDEMARRVRAAVHTVDPALQADVEWQITAWSPAAVSGKGLTVLPLAGYASPAQTEIGCPYCGSGEIRTEGAFGGSLCKRPYTCRACGSPFDALASASA